MDKNFIILYYEFKKIKEQGWIKSLRCGTTGIGYTFEKLLNKEEDNFQIPDYYGIEIKTLRYFSRHKIHLFNAVPDGDVLFPIKRIVNLIGYPDKDFPQYKRFNVSINTTKYTKLGYKLIKLFVNRKREKIDMLVYTIYDRQIKIDTSWSFVMLKNTLYKKLKKLAIVRAKTKVIDGIEYFQYSSISFYKIKNFDSFLRLLESGKISVTFKIGIYKDLANLGKIHDRGTDFSIQEQDIELLFDKV